MATTSALNRGVILTQCRVTAERRLVQALEPLLESAANLLMELGQNANDMAEREQFYAGASRLRNQGEAYFTGFRKGFAERHDAASKALLRGGPGWEELDRETAAMLRTNVLENEVAIIKLGVRLKEATHDDLAELTARLATLCKLQALDDGDNPLGPTAIAHGVYAGFVAARVEGRAARALRPMIEDRLLPPVRELYRSLNQLLDALGIAPHAAPHAAPADAAPAASRDAPTKPAPSRVSPPPAAAKSAGEPAAASPSLAAETAAARRMAVMLRGRTIPDAIHLFLRQTWLRVLARAYDAGGEQGAAWREATGTLEDLVWSVEAKPDAAARARLRGLIPDLLRRLDAGMAYASVTADDRRSAHDLLLAQHRALLQDPGK